MSLSKLIIGEPLRSDEAGEEQLGPWTGLPYLGLDALASAAYGPEAALTVLLLAGASGPGVIVPITVCVVVVLALATFSYLQTLASYPGGGGSFTVAKENLGRIPGLLAASALAVDYILNVAVAISAGVGAIVSAIPPLLPWTLPLCLGILVVLTAVNLRGARSAGLIFTVPTYAYVLCLAATIAIGAAQLLARGHAPPPSGAASRAGPWLLLHAFASGCTALTGIEAVSNAVPVFRRPTVKNARRTLAAMSFVLACLILGVAFLVRGHGIEARPPGTIGYESILSQMVSAVVGRGVFYYVAMAAVLAVLSLSATTSFADFPRLCRLLAVDDYLPARFAHRGSRLVYAHGIVALAIVAGALLVAFGGITDRLIPVFAVGAFLAFTLSQLGVVFHWRRSKEPRARWSLGINAAGAGATGTTLAILAVSKFTEGAWLAILVIPLLVVGLVLARRRRERIERETTAGGPLELGPAEPPIVVVPLKRLDRIARNGLRLALTLSPEVCALQILAEELEEDDVSKSWGRLVDEPARAAGVHPPRLVVRRCPYRDGLRPLLEYLHELADRYPGRTVAVVIPELVRRRWSHFLWSRTTFLKARLLLHGGRDVVVVDAPWYLRSEALAPVRSAG